MNEINLFESLSKPKRKVEKGLRTEENKRIAKQYGADFFDGDRNNGYGGYYYDGRWKLAVKKLQEVYGIDSSSSVLDIGCAKGFLLHDLQEIIPGIKVAGIDISKYAINKAMDGYSRYLQKQGKEEAEANILENKARESLLPHMILESADKLPWADNSFDVVISINTAHNFPEQKCREAIKEMVRVCKDKKKMVISVDAYRTEEERERMNNWVLTAETVKSVDDWLKLYKEEGYRGDYFWFTA